MPTARVAAIAGLTTLLALGLTTAPAPARTVPGFVVETSASDGSSTAIGSGFAGSAFDLAVGPDGRLYVSHLSDRRVSVLHPEDDRIFEDGFEPRAGRVNSDRTWLQSDHRCAFAAEGSRR